MTTKTKTTTTETWEEPVAPVAPTIVETTAVVEDDDDEDNESDSPQALTGQALLDHVASMPEDSPREEIIRLAGYTKKVKDGSVRVMYAQFMEALLEAQGTKLGVKNAPSPGARMGHPLSYITRVHFNGNIMVGKAYVSMLDEHEKGKEFKVVVNPESNPGGINLVPV